MSYPPELHDGHDDFPLCPEKRHIKLEELSQQQQHLYKELNISYGKEEKLITSLGDKHHMVLHYRALGFYLKQGMKLKKVWRAISFKQSNFLAGYIETLTQLRQQATSAFEKNTWKIFIVSLYGKTVIFSCV